MHSYLIIEKWYSQIQTLSEALTVSQAREYSNIDKMFQKELVDPIWDRIVKLGEFTSKRQDRVYFNYTALPGTVGLVHKSGFDALDLCVYLEMAILLKQSGIDFNPISSNEIERVKDIIKLEPELSRDYSVLLSTERRERYEPEDDSIYLHRTKVTWNLKTQMIIEPNGRQMKLGRYVEFLLNKYLRPSVNPDLVGLAELNTKLKQAYQKYTTRKSQANEPIHVKDFYIVISRHPYDLAGMSTGRGWVSCMNLKNGINKRFVKCDVQEGAFIAYLVNKDDLNINSPVGRVLIKPYYHEYDDILLYRPEQKVYGTVPKTFREEVVQILEKANVEENLLPGKYNLPRNLYGDTITSRRYFLLPTLLDKWKGLLNVIDDLKNDSKKFIDGISEYSKNSPFIDKESFLNTMNQQGQYTLKNLNQFFQALKNGFDDYIEILNDILQRNTLEIMPADVDQGPYEIDRFSKIHSEINIMYSTTEKIVNALESGVDSREVEALVLTLIDHTGYLKSLINGQMWFYGY